MERGTRGVGRGRGTSLWDDAVDAAAAAAAAVPSNVATTPQRLWAGGQLRLKAWMIEWERSFGLFLFYWLWILVAVELWMRVAWPHWLASVTLRHSSGSVMNKNSIAAAMLILSKISFCFEGDKSKASRRREAAAISGISSCIRTSSREERKRRGGKKGRGRKRDDDYSSGSSAR